METLVIIAHGSSTTDPIDTPAGAHARELRAHGRFDDVRVAFVQGRPSIDSVIGSIDRGRVIVVPMFVSDGYVSGTLVPEAVEAARGPRVSIRYADPVGTHRGMADVVLDRASEPVDRDGRSDDETSSAIPALAVVGHGSTRSRSCRRVLRTHAARIERRGSVDDVRVFFIEEPPAVDSLPDHLTTDRCVVVPAFMGDGYHVRQDIPRRLGIPAGSRDAWVAVDGVDLWYTGPVGGHPFVSRIVLQRALEAARYSGGGWQMASPEPRTPSDGDSRDDSPGIWQ